MDESWTFLKEAPKSELALVIDACKKSNIDIPAEATASVIIDSIGNSLNGVPLTYEQFLDEVCRQNGIYDDDPGVEDKELIVLRCFLGKGIEKMYEGQIGKFASKYCFSNLDKKKLIREVGVRLKTSNEFKATSFHIVPAFWDIDFTSLFPSDVSDVTELILKDEDIGTQYGPISATLIALKYEHNLTESDYYISKYLDKIIQKDTSFNDKKRAILSVMLCFVKNTIDGDNEIERSIVDEVSSFLENKALMVPEYIINHCYDKEEPIEHLMALLNPCKDNVEGCYKQIYKDLQCFQSIAFFDYKFPYTYILDSIDAYYRMPDEVLDQKAVKLYLLFHGIDSNERLISENDLRNKSLDCAVIPMNSNPADYPSFHKHIQPENPYITGFRDFIQTIGTIDDNSINIIMALKGFMQLDRETMERLAAEMDEKANGVGALEELNALVHMMCDSRNQKQVLAL